MTDKKRIKDLKEVTEIMKQLDENSLLLMANGAKLLLYRQMLDQKKPERELEKV